VYAIVEDSGTQIKMSTGDVLEVDRRDVDGVIPSSLTFDRVLLLAPDKGDARIGTPYLEGVSVEAEVVEEYKGEKIGGEEEEEDDQEGGHFVIEEEDDEEENHQEENSGLVGRSAANDRRRLDGFADQFVHGGGDAGCEFRISRTADAAGHGRRREQIFETWR
jgi:large subunit ribosomal protein L21